MTMENTTNSSKLDLSTSSFSELWESIRALRFVRRPFCILFFIYLFGISAIIRANFYYIDDQGRAFEGFRQWGEVFSRYLADFLSNVIFADSFLTDISPLTQVIAAAEMALAGVLLVYIVSGRKTFDAWMYIALVPLALSPYYLECFSYKFDAPFMALSVLASIAPFLFSRWDPAFYIPCVLVGTLVMCTTYQASSGIIPMVCVFVAYERWQRGERGQWLLIIETVLGYLIGILVFYIFLMKPLPADSYVSADISASSNFFLRFVDNYQNFFGHFFYEFKDFWLEVLIAIIIAFLFVTTVTAQNHVLLAAIMGVGVVVWLFLSAFGLYPFLSKPLVEARSMYGIGVAIALLAVSICSTPRYVVPKVFCLILSWCFFVFAFTYGNFLEVQGQWINFRTEQAINDLSDLELQSSDQPRDLLVVGNAGFAPAFDSMDDEDRAILKSLIRQSFSSDWWGLYGFKHYYRLEQLGKVNILIDENAPSEFDGLPLVKTTVYNRIYQDGARLKLEIIPGDSAAP